MNFSFSIDCYTETLIDGSNSFYELTNFPENESNIPLYRIFPSQSFIDFLISKFGSGEKNFHFYTYIFTVQGNRLRVSGIAKRIKKGYELFCKAEEVADKTFVEEEEKINILEIINVAAKNFMSRTEWKPMLKKTLKSLLSSLDTSRICFYQNKMDSEGNVAAVLTLEVTTRGNKAISQKKKEIFYYNLPPLKRWSKEFQLNQLISSDFNKLPEKEKEILKEHSFSTMLTIPVFTGNELYGFLLFERNEETKWTPDVKSILSSFSSLLGIAIERNSTYKKLLDTEEKLSLITQRTSTVLYLKRFGRKKFDYITSSVLNLTGYNEEEINRIGFNALVKEISKERFRKMELNGDDLTPVETDFLIKTKDGKEKWVADQKFTWKADGKAIGDIGILKDITDRKKFESDLKRTNEILSAIVNFSQSLLNELDFTKNILSIIENLGKATEADRVYIYEATGNEPPVFQYKFEWVTPGMFSRTKEQALEIIKTDEENLPSLQKAIERNDYFSGLTENLPQKEKEIFEKGKIKSFLMVPIKVNGSLYGIIGLDDCKANKAWSEVEIDAIKIAARIIGAAIRMEKFVSEMEKAKNEAEKSDQLKSNFLSQISHEIRTPLNNIVSYLGLLSEYFTDASLQSAQPLIAGVLHGTRRLRRTIELLINASELQVGTYKPYFKEFFVVEDLIEPTFQEFLSFAEEKKLRFTFDCEPEQLQIKSDLYALRKILEHLIDNAIKYTDKGDVYVHCVGKEDRVEIFVRDTGIGIAAEYRKNIFNIFTQESTGTTRKYEGNGLGMYIVKKFADICNVDVSFTSRKNSGTVFKVSIPQS